MQIKLLEIKTMMTEMKNILEEISDRLDTVDKRISELEDIAIGSIKSKSREKKNKQNKQ